MWKTLVLAVQVDGDYWHNWLFGVVFFCVCLLVLKNVSQGYGLL